MTDRTEKTRRFQMGDLTITSLSEAASRGDAELVRDHCDPNCTRSLVTTEFALTTKDRLQNAL